MPPSEQLQTYLSTCGLTEDEIIDAVKDYSFRKACILMDEQRAKEGPPRSLVLDKILKEIEDKKNTLERYRKIKEITSTYSSQYLQDLPLAEREALELEFQKKLEAIPHA